MKSLLKLLTLFSTLSLAATSNNYTAIKPPALYESLSTTATAAGTTTLTVSSNTNQIFTGSTTQTVVMPDATTLIVGRRFKIVNESSGTVTVNKNGGSLIATVGAGLTKEFLLNDNGSSAGGWSTDGGAGSGTVTSVAMSVPGTSILGISGTPITTSGTLALTTTGTSGGIPYFSSSSQLTSSGALTASAIVLGGGAGATPTVVSGLGTTTQVLHGNASGAPTWGALVIADLPTRFMGRVAYAGTTNCRWNTTNTGAAATPSADTDCPTATVTSGAVTASAPSTKIMAIDFASLPAGTYRVVAQGMQGSDDQCLGHWYIKDGTSLSGKSGSYNSTAAINAPLSLEGVFVYGSTQTNIEFQVVFSRESGGGTCYVRNNDSRDTFEIFVEQI